MLFRFVFYIAAVFIFRFVFACFFFGVLFLHLFYFFRFSIVQGFSVVFCVRDSLYRFQDFLLSSNAVLFLS